MKINSVNKVYNPLFGSLRTDKNNVAMLKNGSMPILDNKKENILASLNKMADNPERTNIEFLLDIAGNLEYGQAGNSEFKDIIDETTDVLSERENTDWSEVLADTIRRALSESDEDVSDLKTRYEQIFTQKQPLTPQQREIIELRNQFKKLAVNKNSVEDIDSLVRSAQVSKNIDFFISSSEISFEQKKECLEKFLYFLSDEYPINPQLADKKLQIADEMLDDLLVRVPEQKILTTKGVNQLYSGICAAISMCRKAVGYEDKVRYMDIVLEELRDSPVMQVYDVTDLGSGKTVNIPKINIDYNSAIMQGYRILDASAHHWMQNAHSSGDGSIQSETYTAFDEETYGIFNDTSWYEGFNPDLASEKTLLKNLIKEKELLESVLKQKKRAKEAAQKISEAKKAKIEVQSRINGQLNKIFAEIFPEKPDGDITRLIRSILTFYKGTGDNNEVNISDKMPKDVKAEIIAGFIKEQTNTLSGDEQTNTAIDNNSEKILDCIEKYAEADSDIKKLSAFNSAKSQFAYYRKIFQLAAAHRLAFESDVNLNTGVVRFEKTSGLPVRTKQITSYLDKLRSALDNPEVLKRYSNGASKEQTERDILYDTLRIESTIPKQLDDISISLFGSSLKEQTRQILSEVKEQIKFGNKDLASMVSSVSGTKNDKTQIVNYLDKWINKFDTNITEEEIDEAIRIIGFEDRIHMFKAIFAQFIMRFNSGISEEEMSELIQRFGGEDKIASAIQNKQNKLEEVINSYESILKRWEVPSSRQLIIEKAEKDRNILTEQKLRILKKKFDEVRSLQSKNDSIENIKERQKANRKLYDFTNDELDILKSVEKSLPFIKKYCKTEYSTVNKELFDELEKQYAQIGMLNGQFWVREEGSTGLSANEQVRIIEQMTGKPYHIERDIEKAVKHIKKGDGSGVINYSVDDASYAFHAQYVPSVTRETRIVPKTGEKITEDIVWTDNSWGKAEKEYFWNGRNGFKYTDYGSGYGWKNGFMLADDLRIGQSLASVKTSTGMDKQDKDEFSLFLDMVLQGTPVDAYQKLYKMFSYILSMDQGCEYYSALENLLKSGNKISLKHLEGLDGLVETKTDSLIKRIEKIKTREDFDKLPQDGYIRFLLEAVSVYMATNHPELADSVLAASSFDELEDIKEHMRDELVEEIAGLICKSDDTVEKLMLACSSDINTVFDDIEKNYNIPFDKQERADILAKVFMLYDEEKLDSLDGTFDAFSSAVINQVEIAATEKISDEKARGFFTEKVREIIKRETDEYLKIKSLDSSILANSPLYDEFIAAVDKYLKPSSDKELLDLIMGLQNTGYEQANVFLSALDYEDLGLDFKDPYDYIQKLRTGDSAVMKAFSQIVASNVISSELKSNVSEKTVEVSEEDDEDINVEMSPSDLYRTLYVKLSDMDVQKYIRDFKAEAFRKYKVRQAFPQPVVIKDEEIAKICADMYDYFNNLIIDMKKNDFIISVFDRYSDVMKNLKSAQLYKAVRNGDVFVPDDTNEHELDNILNLLTSYSDFLSEDESLELIKAPVDELIGILSENDGEIDSQEVMSALDELQSVFSVWKSSGVVKEHFVQARREGISDIKNMAALLINSNVVPKYKDEAFERVNKIINLMRKGRYDEELEYEENEFIEFLINRHILKEPTTLLNECVKMLQSHQDESKEYEILKSYLIKALKIAQQTKAQYQMVQNAHEGISSKTKELLPLFNVTLSDGTKESMKSEMGMIYLINQLENESDDHTTLKLFLAQSGLAKLSLSALLNNFNGDKSMQIVNETYDVIMKSIDDFERLNEIIDNFMNLKKTPFKSLEEAIKQLRNFVEGKVKNNKESLVFSKYLDYIDSVKIRPELKNASPDIILPLLISFNKDAVAYAGEDINSQIDYLSEISSILEGRKILIDIVDVPEDSEENQRRIAFAEEYEEAQQIIQDRMRQIQEKIENSDFMSAEYVE